MPAYKSFCSLKLPKDNKKIMESDDQLFLQESQIFFYLLKVLSTESQCSRKTILLSY